MSTKQINSPQTKARKQELECKTLDDHEKAFTRAQTLVSQLMDAASKDILSVETATTSSNFSTKTTVGMMLAGCTVDNLVVGGPAA
eukprot:2020743-Rhodomonas_salina.1